MVQRAVGCGRVPCPWCRPAARGALPAGRPVGETAEQQSPLLHSPPNPPAPHLLYITGRAAATALHNSEGSGAGSVCACPQRRGTAPHGRHTACPRADRAGPAAPPSRPPLPSAPASVSPRRERPPAPRTPTLPPRSASAPRRSLTIAALGAGGERPASRVPQLGSLFFFFLFFFFPSSLSSPPVFTPPDLEVNARSRPGGSADPASLKGAAQGSLPASRSAVRVSCAQRSAPARSGLPAAPELERSFASSFRTE